MICGKGCGRCVAHDRMIRCLRGSGGGGRIMTHCGMIVSRVIVCGGVVGWGIRPGLGRMSGVAGVLAGIMCP